MAIAPGTHLGPYEIQAPLGAGGMGEVYRARDTRLGRDVAIKVLPQHLSASPEDRARFKREAKTISSFNHPHICVLYDVGQEGDTDYLVMELVEGETLAQRLGRGALPAAEVLKLGTQIADALDRAHRAGVIHRDLKPGNVMLTRSGAKLVDFGLARGTVRAGRAGGADITATAPGSHKSEEPITAKGTVVGTFQYMAPEQLEGKEADARSDLWALGCVLYEMSTGKRAFDGSTPASLISAIMRDQPRVMVELAPMTPPALERVVTQCLAKDPDDRWQTAGDLRRELSWIAEAGSRAGVPAPVSAKRAGRERLGWVLAGLVAVVAVTFSVLWWRAAENEARQFTFAPLTFKPMAIFKAAFAPDGKTVVFSGAFEGNVPRIYIIRPENPEPQPISDPGTHLLSVSREGELAVLTGAQSRQGGSIFRGTLARMPMGGGVPRELLQDVIEADWSPDGSRLAIIRDVNGKDRLEFPIGSVIHETGGNLSDLRFSPRGSQIAYVEHPDPGETRGYLCITDLHGNTRRLTDDYTSKQGVAWSPDGKEIYFSSSLSGDQLYAVSAVTTRGKRHSVLEVPGGQAIQDVGRDGRWLTTRDDRQVAIMVHKPGWSEDRDLSWLDGSVLGLLSHDAGVLVFTEQAGTVGDRYAVCLRKTGGSGMVRLGEGTAWDMSPDGKKVLALVPAAPAQLVIYPTGVGDVQRLARGEIDNFGGGRWHPSGDSIVILAGERGRAFRCYVQALSGGRPQAFTPEGIGGLGGISKDGSKLLLFGPGGSWFIYPRSGGKAERVPCLTGEDFVNRWNSEAGTALVQTAKSLPDTVEQVDLATGRRAVVMRIVPRDRVGLMGCVLDAITDDHRSYAYHAWWLRSRLFLGKPRG